MWTFNLQEIKLFQQDFSIQLSGVVDVQLLHKASDALGTRVSFTDAVATVPSLALGNLLQWHGYQHQLKMHGMVEMQAQRG